MDFKMMLKTSVKAILHGLILCLMFSVSGFSFMLLFYSHGDILSEIVSYILLFLNALLFCAYGKNYWVINGLEKPTITIKYSRKEDKMIVLSCDDADKCVNIETIIEED